MFATLSCHEKEKLTVAEAIQIIQIRRHDDIQYVLKGNQLVQDVIDRCGRLPLAMAIIGGLNLKSDDDWQDVIDVIVTPKSESMAHDYRENLFQTFELSIKQLNSKHAELFRSLGVFKAVNISLQSITSLWQVKELEAKPILKELNSRSLLTFEDGNRLGVNNTSIIYNVIYVINNIESIQAVKVN